MLCRFVVAATLGPALALFLAAVAPPSLAADPAATAPVAAPPASSTASLPLKGDQLAARVNGSDIHLSDVEAVQQSLPPQAKKLPLAQIYPLLLERMIDATLVADAARKQHLQDDPEVQSRLKLLEDRLLQQAYIEKLIKSAETNDKLNAAYQKFIKDKPAQDEIHARHILVKTEAEAASIIKQLDSGADFAVLAKKYSTDSGAASGGDLGWFTKGDMVPAFSAAAFALKPGQYTKTPVKTEFGWHVILVTERRVKPPPTFAEAREEVSRTLAREIVEAKLKELRCEAKVETFGLDGKPLPAPH